MKFFKQLFNSHWRERVDPQVVNRFSRHYDSMAEQVMANRKEIAYLHYEVNRLSGDLAQAMMLNRALIKHLLTEGGATPEQLEQALTEILTEHDTVADPTAPPSKFCEDCGRPLATPGRDCPYCSELGSGSGETATDDSEGTDSPGEEADDESPDEAGEESESSDSDDGIEKPPAKKASSKKKKRKKKT